MPDEPESTATTDPGAESEPQDGESEPKDRESTVTRVRRLAEELSESAVGSERMASARDRLAQVSRSVLTQLNVAPEDEVEELRNRVADLEARVAALEPKPRRTKEQAADDAAD
jgi:hypothetical protein